VKASKSAIIAVAFSGCITVALTFGAVVRFRAGPTPGSPAPSTTPGCAAAGKTPQRPYLGVSVMAPQEANLAKFTAATGVTPSIIASYQAFGAPFNARQACQIARTGAIPLIQIDPRDQRLPDITAGRYDSYLRSYARAVKAARITAALSFGHEMNGSWYPWGAGHVLPDQFVAAWRHIHDVFAYAGARNVIWVWTVNNATTAVPRKVRPWWPGDRYVTWVGIDGYYWTPRETFSYAFDLTISKIRAFTAKPILITETGIYPGPGMAARVTDLFGGVESAHLLGFVYFDHIGSRGQDWRLEGNPAALAAYRQAADGMQMRSSR
jgi:mannan endo-1,4-beta-mannosidase